MNEENSDFNLILNPPNYEKILFGFPSYREERLIHYRLYVFQQRFFNPDNIPKKKKTSLYQVSLHHLELWIEDSFVQTYDQPCFDSLAFAWSRAQHDNIPFSDACNVYFNNNEIQTTPIKTHATLTEIFHIGINLYNDKNLPEVWARQSRDKDKKFYKDDIYSLWRWLLELILRLANLFNNYTVATESLIKYLWIHLYMWSLFPTLHIEDALAPPFRKTVPYNSCVGGIVKDNIVNNFRKNFFIFLLFYEALI
ncbi:unnamed protein product [Rhizophagus irregularis]|nr:unnamed protein product [Rhizophagus irregularis]